MIPPKLGDAWLPKILIPIGKETHHAILDLGSSVLALSKEFYDLLELRASSYRFTLVFALFLF